MTARVAIYVFFAVMLRAMSKEHPDVPTPLGAQMLPRGREPGLKLNASAGHSAAGRANATLQAALTPPAGYPNEEQCFRYCNNIGRKWWWCRWDACACYDERSDGGACHGDACNGQCKPGEYGWCLWGRCMCLQDLYTYKGLKC